MKKVVAIGELLIDFVPQQRGCALDEVVQFERVAGGAPANVATAVARLGGRAQMISQVGEDAFGTHILKTLHANGVDTSSVFRTGRANTALAFVSLDKNGNRNAGSERCKIGIISYKLMKQGAFYAEYQYQKFTGCHQSV